MTNSKREAFEAYRNGDLTEDDAREFFNEEEWEDVQQLDRVENILADQPEPDTNSDDFFL